MATAKVIFHEIGNKSKVLTFETNKAQLFVRQRDDGRLTMDFPQYKTEIVQTGKEPFIDEIVKEISGDLEVERVCYAPGAKKLLIVLHSKTTRSDLETLPIPNPDRLLQIHPSGDIIRGVIVTVKVTTNSQKDTTDQGEESYDFLSRYFAPWVGIAEDPATGSAHCVSGPYWAAVLGKNQLSARQCSKRGAEFHLNVRNDERIELSGHAIVVIRGKITVS